MFNENTWKYGENLVKDYMIKQGYKILYTNFSCVKVELDVVSILPAKIQVKKIKLDLDEKIKHLKEINDITTIKILEDNFNRVKNNIKDLLVITEIKARRTGNYGFGSDAINQNKIKNIKKGANYLLLKKEFKDMQIRFDVASVDGEKINYIENAFY